MSRTIEDVSVGDPVGPVSIGLSIQRLVMIAAANRDFAPTHHDAAVARATGADGAYTNMMFVMAMMERAVQAWGGSASRLRALSSVRMVAFNRAGDTVTCRGTVTAVDTETREVSLELWLETEPDRRTATAAARVTLPSAASAFRGEERTSRQDGSKPAIRRR
ncbi:MAG TPA: MaoC/PaaZ C-terminal domain-containing protein [Amycolatopsis sp.]|nr:MaoC/PaaZ C-terminal domain-containing protein [Amycolatopsis sp.]